MTLRLTLRFLRFAINVVEYERGGARILQTTEIRPEAATALRALRINTPPRLHHVQARPKA